MTDHAVVIAGGGPTGLMLAAELALARVDVVVVERRPSQELVGSRAGGLHARTIEVLDQRGIADRFLSQGQVMQVAGFSFIPLDISDFPTRHNYGLALRQNRIEPILADWVSELSVKLVRNTEVTGFAQDDAGVDVELSDGRSIRAKYLVGCDGGRSLIRKKAGIELAGWDASTSYLIAEVEMTDEPAWGIRRGEKGVNAIGKLDDGKRAGVVLVEPHVARGGEGEPTLQDLRDALVAVYGTDFGVRNPTWLSRFSDMARQAVSYRERRVLLAGDAAHVHAPAGGQGLNIGVQDAVNLGWKLAQVVHGTSPASLLDTYQAERHPIAARVLRLTMAQTALGRGDANTEALRETVTDLLKMDQPRKRYAAIMSGLDIRYDLGEGHALLGRRMPDLDIVTERGAARVVALLHEARPVLLNLGERGVLDDVVASWTDRVRTVDARYDGLWELPELGAVSAPTAVLIRPDGYVAWVGIGGSDDGLRDALTKWFGTPFATLDASRRRCLMRVACVLGDGFKDSEFRVPYDKLKAAGHEVVVIGAKKGERIAGKDGKEKVEVDLAIDDARAESFGALLVPGGYSPDHLRADDRFVAFTRAFASKPVLAICHGPQLLITADMVKGRTLTAWKTVQVDLRHAGANVVDQEVCVDRNLVTSRKPEDLDAFVRESVKLLMNGASVAIEASRH